MGDGCGGAKLLSSWRPEQGNSTSQEIGHRPAIDPQVTPPRPTQTHPQVCSTSPSGRSKANLGDCTLTTTAGQVQRLASSCPKEGRKNSHHCGLEKQHLVIGRTGWDFQPLAEALDLFKITAGGQMRDVAGT